jgi:uncharacterized low-complexity protein
MKKLITAACATAFVLGTTLAFAEDTKQSNPTEKTPTQQQMDTQKTGGSKMKSGTTGAGMSQSNKGSSKLPGKPTDDVKDSVKK